MRAHRAWPIVVAASALLVPACLLTTSLDGLSGGDAPDGAPPVTTAVDASADGPVTDGPGADVVDAAVPFRCADHAAAVFCADFETEPYDVGFDEVDTDQGGLFGAGTGRFGRGLTAQTPQHTAATRPYAFRSKKLATISPGTSFTYAYDILIESPAGTGTLDYGGFYYNGPFYQMTIRSHPDGTVSLHEYADAYQAFPVLNRDQSLAHGLVPGAWTHVTIAISFAPGGGSSSVKLRFDDEVMLDGPSIDAYRYGSTPPKVPVGIFGAEDMAKAVNMSFDDVLVTVP